MSRGAGPSGNPALEAWSKAGLREIMLPTGTEVQVRLPSAEGLIKRGAIPPTLTGMAMKYAVDGVNTSQLDEVGMREFLALVDILVVNMVKAVRVGDEWMPVTLTPETLDEFEFPKEDMDALGLIAIRAQSPEMVTLQSKIARGLVEPSKAAQEKKEAEQADDSSAPLASFHPDGEVPDPRPNSGAVRPASLNAGGALGSSGRARLRPRRSRPAR